MSSISASMSSASSSIDAKLAALQIDVGFAMAGKIMETQETLGQNMVESLKQAASATGVGQNMDLRV